MTLLKCVTHVVGDLPAAIDRYAQWLDYPVVETGRVTNDTASSWLSSATAGCPYVVLQPASGAQVFLRLIEIDDKSGAKERPMHTYGWAATEICVQDVELVNDRMLQRGCPFDIVGPPHVLDGFPMVKPMQVRGKDDGETIYFTSFLDEDPNNGLPRPRTLIDRPFIIVLACENLRRCMAWVDEVLGLQMQGPFAIRNTVLEMAFGLGRDSRHELTTVAGEGEMFLELDQLPQEATKRPCRPDTLPPGVAITTMIYPNFDRLEKYWAVRPVPREGKVYGGRRVGLLKTPDGALLEVVES